jgi:hypothetical protein
MEWSEEEIQEGSEANRTGGTRAAMTRAVELAAARGGTMTAEELRVAIAAVDALSMPKDWQHDYTAALAEHIAAQGAKVTELTTWLADLTGVLCGERPMGVMPSTTLDAARALKAKVAALGAFSAEAHGPEAWESLKATCAALEKERDNARQSEAVWRKRLEEAGEHVNCGPSCPGHRP